MFLKPRHSKVILESSKNSIGHAEKALFLFGDTIFKKISKAKSAHIYIPNIN